MPPRFVTPTARDRKLQLSGKEFESRKRPTYRQLPPPRRGRPSCNDAVRWRSEFGSGSFYSPEPGRATAFRDTPPSQAANRESFVYVLGHLGGLLRHFTLGTQPNTPGCGGDIKCFNLLSFSVSVSSGRQ